MKNAQFSRWTAHAVAIAIAALASSGAVDGQVVRGTVTERASSAPIPGTLVTLEPVSGDASQNAAVLSNGRGEFAIRATAGRFRLTAKRIGVQRFVSEPFDLAAGETRRVDVSLEALAFKLPEVRVVDGDMCVLNESDRTRVASLWDEARTVLTAAQISLRDRLFEGHLTRYVRGLNPRTLRVLEESWSERRGMMDRPFVSQGGDSLSRLGYRRTIGEFEYYYAPDADVLVSSAFRRDHCYSVVEGRGERRGMVGIAFEPLASRRIPDVRGTLWMDGRTFELKLVDFRYTMMPEFDGSDRVGGEVHFGKLDTGAWVTSRWFMRFPQFARPVSPVDAHTRIPSVIVRPTMHRLVEEGGMVFTSGLKLFARPASVAGTVLDSAGRPFPEAIVRLGGTPFATLSGADGTFRLDSLPASRFTLVAEHPSYTQLGSFLGDEPVDLREGSVVNANIRAPNTKALVERLCEGKLPKDDNGAIRVIVVDSATSRPLPSLRVWLRWAGRFRGNVEQPSSLSPTAVGGFETVTDASGASMFCDVPAGIPLYFSAVMANGRQASDSTSLRLEPKELKAVTVHTRRP
jgi:hypothetical protein